MQSAVPCTTRGIDPHPRMADTMYDNIMLLGAVLPGLRVSSDKYAEASNPYKGKAAGSAPMRMTQPCPIKIVMLTYGSVPSLYFSKTQRADPKFGAALASIAIPSVKTKAVCITIENRLKMPSTRCPSMLTTAWLKTMAAKIPIVLPAAGR